MNSETDIGTIRLIIKSAVGIALFSLLAGIGLALNAGRENAVVVAAAGALLSVPASCLTGLFGLLAKTSTTRQSSLQALDSSAQPMVPIPVTVANPSIDPVPVAEAGAKANSTPNTAAPKALL